MSKEKRINMSFIGVAVAIFVSKLLGFARTLVFANIFKEKLGVITDLFTNIESAPTLIFTSVGLALSYVNIPRMLEIEKNGGKEGKRKYLSNFYTQIVIFSATISLLGIIVAPAFAKLVIPDVTPVDYDKTFHLAVVLIRIIIPTLMFISNAYITEGVLQAHGKYTFSKLISIPANIVTIFTLFIFKDNIFALTTSVSLGWLLQFIIQIPLFVKLEKGLRPVLEIDDPNTKANFSQFALVLIGNLIIQVFIISDKLSALNSLESGISTLVHFGSYIFMTITGVFAIAVSTVIFPKLSRYSIDGNYERIRQTLKYTFKLLMAIIVPYLIIASLFNFEIFDVFFSYNKSETEQIASIFFVYSFAAIGYMAQEVYNRVFYAVKQYKIPVILSIVFAVINIIANSILAKSLGVIGITISTMILLNIYAIVITILASKTVGKFFDIDLVTYFLKLLIPGAFMLVLAMMIKNYIMSLGFGMLYVILIPIFISGTIYLIIGYLTNFKQLFRQGIDHQ